MSVVALVGDAASVASGPLVALSVAHLVGVLVNGRPGLFLAVAIVTLALSGAQLFGAFGGYARMRSQEYAGRVLDEDLITCGAGRGATRRLLLSHYKINAEGVRGGIGNISFAPTILGLAIASVVGAVVTGLALSSISVLLLPVAALGLVGLFFEGGLAKAYLATEQAAAPHAIRARVLARLAVDRDSREAIYLDGLGGRTVDAFGAEIDAVVTKYSEQAKHATTVRTFLATIRMVGELAVIAIALALYGRGPNSAAPIALAIGIAAETGAQFEYLVYRYRDIASLRVNLRRMGVVRSYRDHEPSPRGLSETDLVQVKDLNFQYPESGEHVLDGVNFAIKPGEVVALVGENGAGKSTLVKLVLGLLDPTEGVVRHSERFRPSAVFQDFARLELRLRESVALGRDDRDVAGALQAVGAQELLDRFGDQRIGERWSAGFVPSGGEWQKIALARALCLREATLLVCDEPAASLDVRTERATFRAVLERRTPDTSVLFVSHRLGPCADADKILVLSGGRLVEVGQHAELLARGGHYARLWREAGRDGTEVQPLPTAPAAT